VLLAIALGATWPLFALAQSDNKGATKADAKSKGASKDDQAADEAPAKDAAKGPDVMERAPEQNKQATVDTSQVRKSEQVETWKDPNVDAALGGKFQELPAPGRPLSQAQESAVVGGQADAATIKRYIDKFAADLTKRSYLDAVGDPDAAANLVQSFEDASRKLAQPLVNANANRRNQFRSEYTAALVPVVRNLLKNHLYARVAGMVALSRSADPKAIPVFIEVLKDPNQVLAVKERAAVGLINVAQGGQVDLDPGTQAIPAAQALVEFLNNEQDTFWPAQARALEALGALRQSANPGRAQAEFATTALKFLADPKAKPDVRASAAWALGMMRVSGGTAKYNFGLIGYHIGQAAVDVGNRIVEADADRRPGRVRHLTDLLLELIDALSSTNNGNIANAGLLNANHPNLGASRPFLSQLDAGLRKVAQAAVDLDKSPAERAPDPKAKKPAGKGPRARQRDALAAQVNELKAFLAKNPPSNWALVPGGPEFRGPQAQVARSGRDQP
jgi:hypothetical protein